MNQQRNYYFLRQKAEQLEELTKEFSLKEKEFTFREMVLEETKKLIQIKHVEYIGTYMKQKANRCACTITKIRHKKRDCIKSYSITFSICC